GSRPRPGRRCPAPPRRPRRPRRRSPASIGQKRRPATGGPAKARRLPAERRANAARAGRGAAW
ncbi:hypothetical protein D6Z83_16610, partial [Pseudoroseomonas wenyumeiae]